MQGHINFDILKNVHSQQIPSENSHFSIMGERLFFLPLNYVILILNVLKDN